MKPSSNYLLFWVTILSLHLLGATFFWCPAYIRTLTGTSCVIRSEPTLKLKNLTTEHLVWAQLRLCLASMPEKCSSFDAQRNLFWFWVEMIWGAWRLCLKRSKVNLVKNFALRHDWCEFLFTGVDSTKFKSRMLKLDIFLIAGSEIRSFAVWNLNSAIVNGRVLRSFCSAVSCSVFVFCDCQDHDLNWNAFQSQKLQLATRSQ